MLQRRRRTSVIKPREIALIIRYIIYRRLNHLLSESLLKSRTDNCFLTEEKFEHIKRCVVLAYPEEDEHDYIEYSNVNDFLESILCEHGQIYVLTGQDWYFILIRELTHVVAYDFASATGKCREIFKIYGILMELFRGQSGYLLCRESTSYPLVKLLEKRGDYKIIKDKCIIRQDEKYHKLFVKVRKHRKSTKNKRQNRDCVKASND